MTQATYPNTIKNYQILEELGSGAFSVVCKAKHLTSGQIFACKVFPKTNLTDQGDLDRFQREINAMAFLRHESIVSLYDFFWDETNFYLLMDLCPGGELFDYIVKNDKLDEPTAAVIFEQIANSLNYCHSLGVAHRDLKPENVLITQFPAIKVSDFGLCGYISDQKLMKTFCGSPCYCAPECLCRVQYDGRLSDVWSLGVILFAMITGEHPWNITNTSIMLRQILKGSYTIPPFVSSQCKDIINKMMQVNPKDRITVEEILKHPWIKIANKSRHKKTLQNKHITPSNLPSLKGLTIEEISQASARSSQKSESGIFSPFEENEVETGTLPILCIRSASSQNLLLNSTQSLEGSSRTKITSSGSMLSANRQRSAANLLAKKTPQPKSNNLPMMTITEE